MFVAAILPPAMLNLRSTISLLMHSHHSLAKRCLTCLPGLQQVERNQMEELSSNIPLSLFRYKIGSFSSLLTSSVERFESCEFDAGDYKWKLSLYPNGKKEKGGKDHISLYLKLANNISFDPNKEILVSFRLFALDHIREKYFSGQEVSRFSFKKSESGFDKFLGLDIFNDPSNGYLVDDTCMFGIEVFAVLSVGIGQLPVKYRWKVEGFSKLGYSSYSDTFTAGGQKWRMVLFPRGTSTAADNVKYVSLFIMIVKRQNLESGKKVDVEFKLRLVDQVGNEHWEKRLPCALNTLMGELGFHKFIPLSDLKNTSSSYLVEDTCILEAEGRIQFRRKSNVKQ